MKYDQNIFTRLLNFLRGSDTPDAMEAFDEVFEKYERKPGYLDNLGEAELTAHGERLFEKVQHATQEEVLSRRRYINVVFQSGWFRAAAAVSLLITASMTLIKLYPDSFEEMITLRHTIDSGKRGTLTLPDGSKVLLNSGSSISYRRWFLGSTRQVKLSGEAFFQVTRNEEKPFTIYSGNIRTTVLGTSFNVRSYPQWDEATVSVATGKVNVATGEKSLSTLTANQEITVNQQTGAYIVKNDVDVEKRIAWQKGRLVFDNATLQHVAALLSNYHSIDINFSSPALKNRTITADFEPGTSIENVLQVLGQVNHFTYKQLHHEIILYENLHP